MSKITTSSTAEYFAKNLQQVGFSSPTKAVLTTLKEAVDNALDACEEAGIPPELSVFIHRLDKGSSKTSDLIEIIVEDNGPGIETEDLAKVFGEYLASSKFGRGQCSRGQQGIGISAATTWAQLTNAAGVQVISKTAKMRKATKAQIDVDIKGNKGILKNKETIDWDRPHGTRVEFRIDGRVQLNGDGGVITYLDGTTLVNPHMTLHYKLLENDLVDVVRVSDEVPHIPAATLPHPHTMKLGEFITHAHLYGRISLDNFLRKGFSRVTDATIKDFVKNGLPKGLLSSGLSSFKEDEFKKVFQVVQNTELVSPSTKSVLTVGEEGLSKSIHRLGDVDFFSVVTRKPRICDFKPTVVEVAIARFLNKPSESNDSMIQLLRFANRVPLQFDKAACAITKSVESVNWRAYGLQQAKNSLPLGSFVFAVSVTSPFIKFKNASKETIDASDELVEEIRRTLMQAGQKLSRHIRAEDKAADLERKILHIEKFGPILVDGLVRISGASQQRKKNAQEGLQKLLGRDADVAESELAVAERKLSVLKAKQAHRLGLGEEAGDSGEEGDTGEEFFEEETEVGSPSEDVGDFKAKQRGTTKKAAKARSSTSKKVATTKIKAEPAKKK